MEKIIILSFIVLSISFTITVTSIFKWLRELISSIHPKLEELIHCPYCLSHYITILLLIICNYRYLFTKYIVVNYILTTFCIVGIVSVLHYIVLRAYEPIAKQMMQRHIDKMNENE